MDAPCEVACGRVYNVGNPDERYIVDFARLIRDLAGAPVPIEFRPAPAEDPSRRCPDITRIRTEIGWEPRVSLADGLERTLAWFRTVVTPSDETTPQPVGGTSLGG
jgi:dTDP-glucose 4,6-dehydratase